ncbi:MAG: ArsR/SmtB family transcription factor [Nocardioidaceae bacterium]
MSAVAPAAGPVAAVARLLGDDSRAAMCLALLDGRAWTSGELARLTGVAPSTASDHLTRLVAGGLLAEERQGRHRYVRLATPRAAELIEELAAHAAPAAAAPRSLRAVTATAALARARTCYDHLAGRLGVRLADAMADGGLLGQATGWAFTPDGLRWLRGLGIDVDALVSGRRPLVRACLDWTERRSHLGGAGGAALCRHFFEAGWLERTATHRAVRVTGAGNLALRDLLGIDAGQLEGAAPTAVRGPG